MYTLNSSRFILIFQMIYFCNIHQGITGLRLHKVIIPAYKLRGESAFLECQYELKKSNINLSDILNENKNSNNNNYYDKHNNNNMNYKNIDIYDGTSDLTLNNTNNNYYSKQLRNYEHLNQKTYQKYYHQQHQQQQQQNNYNNDKDIDHHQQYQLPLRQQIYLNKTYRHDDIRFRDNINNNYDNSNEQINNQNQNDNSEQLYAVKWYKDNEEFYRYVPKVNPPKQSYRVDGIRVVEEHSDSTKVLLRGLTLNSTGLYRCEVSAEAPNFSSVQGDGRMDIVYLPRDGPHIKGREEQYQIGDTLNLNCTSGKSHPASQLQWFINDKLLVHSSSLIRYNDTVHKHGLITSTLGLQLTVDARHFQDGAMRVKCLASISPVLWKGGRESVLQRRPGVIDNREAMLLVIGSSSGLIGSKYLLVFLIINLLGIS